MDLSERPRRSDPTFRGNGPETRYGWLRLTPAYSIHVVTDLLDTHIGRNATVLDPFCGTGTTALVCAERGIACTTTDINPFLHWLARVKTNTYHPAEIAAFVLAASAVADAMQEWQRSPTWVPPLHQIERWWDTACLGALGRAWGAIVTLEAELPPHAGDLLRVAFCRVMIESAAVSFGHQSMSFKRPRGGHVAAVDPAAHWPQAVARIAAAAASPIQTVPQVQLCDARALEAALERAAYSCVITSPPYPNRMSYIRELRPYMYWLGYLGSGREAGELDWRAIGGTWGSATSNLTHWVPSSLPVPFTGFSGLLERIAERSPLLSRYVHRYFEDMVQHCQALMAVLRPGATLHYIVGNSRFYDVLLPVEQIFADLFRAAGCRGVEVRTLRKRSSKRELFEYVVSAHL